MTPPEKNTPGPEIAYNVVGEQIGEDREQPLRFPLDR